MSTVAGIIVGIVGLGFLILVHELGHFLVAKATKMRVEEFNLGFGPYVVKRRWGETVYGIRWIPLGGSVRVTGMHKEEFEQRIADLREQEAEEVAGRAAGAEVYRAPSTGETRGRAGASRPKRRPGDPEDRLAGKRALSAEEIASTPLERRYYSHPLWHKLLFIVAGVAMNVIVAYALLGVVGLVEGDNWLDTVVSKVEENGGAAEAGIRAKDRIVSVAGQETDRWDELQMEILKHKGETVPIVVERDGEFMTFGEVEIKVGEDGLGRLGVYAPTKVEHRDIGFLDGFAFAGRETWGTVVTIFDGIGMMFARDVPVTGSGGLAGPVGIVQISAEVVQEGFTSYLWLVALISVNLALLNMLPLLPLDGGHVVLSIVERIRGRAVPLRIFERVSMVGLVLFVMLFLVAMYNDVGRIFTGF